MCGGAWRARRNQFVARRKHRDPDTPAHVNLGQAKRRGERDILRPQALSGCERRRTGGNIFPGRTHVGARSQALRQNDPTIAIDSHILLHEHRVGAIGHRRAGENPHRVPRLNRCDCRLAGLNAPRHGKGNLSPWWKIAATHRITIDRRVGERRQRQGSGNVGRENAPVSLCKRDRLGLPHRRDPRGDDAYGFIDRHHRAAESKAIVG